jgi:hypothetical protein
MLCGRDLWEQHERWSVKVYPIVTASGTFYDWNAERAKALNELVRSAGVSPAGRAASRRASTETVAGQPAMTPALPSTLAVFPEGITINYLTGTTTPLSFHTFTPVETADPQIEDEILREIQRRPPDRVAIVKRDVREYGYRGFGVDYDQRLAAWIVTHYAVERQWPGLIDLRRR